MSIQEVNTKKVYSISNIVFWDRFSLYGLQSFLVLYLGAAFGFLDKADYTFFGTYTALSFAFTVLGGFIADRLLGIYNAAMVGGVLIIFANIILCIPHIEAVYVGLAFMVVGIGLLKPNNTNLLGMIHEKDSPHRSRAFSIFYIGISIGSILGPLIYGLAYATKYYWCGFAISAVGTLLAFLYLQKFKNDFNNPQNQQIRLTLPKCFLVISLCVLVSLILIRHNQLFSYFMVSVVLFSIFFANKFLKQMTADERLAVFSLLPPILGGIIFFTAFLQIYSSITFFIERYVNRHVFLGWEIPATWFSSIEPLCILFVVPLLNWAWQWLNKRNINLSPKSKVMVGLFVTSLAFLVFCLMTKTLLLNHYWIISMLLIANILLAAGELCIIPVTMSLINSISPISYKGTLMGFFYFSLTFSGYLSGFVAKISPATPIASPTDFTYLFVIISALLFISGIFLAFLNNAVQKLTVVNKQKEALAT